MALAKFFVLLPIPLFIQGCQSTDLAKNPLWSPFEPQGQSSHQSPWKAKKSTAIRGAVAPNQVINGHTFILQGRTIYLDDIKAPTVSQMCRKRARLLPCGMTSKNTLAGFVMGAEVTCTLIDGTGRYGTSYQCLVGNFDLSEGMLRAGQAAVIKGKSFQYVTEQHKAKTRKLGIWGTDLGQSKNWGAGS